MQQDKFIIKNRKSYKVKSIALLLCIKNIIYKKVDVLKTISKNMDFKVDRIFTSFYGASTFLR